LSPVALIPTRPTSICCGAVTFATSTVAWEDGRLVGFLLAYLETTVTTSNHRCARMLEQLAERQGTTVRQSELFATQLFPPGHEVEILTRLGPRRDGLCHRRRGRAGRLCHDRPALAGMGVRGGGIIARDTCEQAWQTAHKWVPRTKRANWSTRRLDHDFCPWKRANWWARVRTVWCSKRTRRGKFVARSCWRRA
jgi:hypothetical protein